MKLSSNPQRVSAELWYYEEKRGLEIVHEIRDKETGIYIRADHILIPWRKIFQSVERYKRNP